MLVNCSKNLFKKRDRKTYQKLIIKIREIDFVNYNVDIDPCEHHNKKNREIQITVGPT